MAVSYTNVLTADDILGIADIPVERVEVPEWGGCVYVRGLNGKDRGLYENKFARAAQSKKPIDISDSYAELALMCCVDSDEPGAKRIFNKSQLSALHRKSAIALNRIGRVALRLSGMTSGEVEKYADDFLTMKPNGSGLD